MRELDETILASADYGNKARGLAWLRSKGFPVPDAFVLAADDVTDAAHEVTDQDSVWSAVEALTPKALDQSGAASLAVRSSSADEDSVTRSGAGRFESVIGVFGRSELLNAIKEVRKSGYPDSLPVIVQVAINPLVSGVAFSCDPVSFDRKPYLVSWTEGLGQNLVAGREEGSLLVARSASDYDDHWPLDPAILNDLISVLDAMEAELQGPADVEWAVDGDGKLWLLQARPVVLPQARYTDVRTAQGLEALPGVIAGNSRMRLRAAAFRSGVMMPNAAVLTACGTGSISELPEWIPSRDTSGLSIVLLHPCGADSKVQREFAQVNATDVPFFTHGCRRYAIRRYPSHETALAVANDVLSRGLKDGWVASILVQEIYDAAATGIVRRLGCNYVAELVVGHFVSKGVVEPSRFIIAESGEVLESRRVDQDIAYRFINGHVVTEHPVEEQLQLSDDEVACVVTQIAQLFAEYPDAALEFGIIKDRRGALHGFVIDMAEGDSKSSAVRLDPGLIRDGVLSPGRAEGKALRLANDANAELDTHLPETPAAPGENITDTVFIADRASVDLIPLVNRCGNNTAFVFRRASLLAHLCVVLREHGIPAISLGDDDLFGKLTSGSVLTVEASDPNWIRPRVI